MEHEYISRKELIVWLMPYLHLGEEVAPEVLIADIRAMKAADVVPVRHGRWIDKGSLSCRCSECGCKSTKESPYCHICGAIMDRED